MFAKVFAVASLALLAVATPTPGGPASCSTGDLQCCNTVESASSPGAAELLGLVRSFLNMYLLPHVSYS